jgi:hypothetical protein
LVGRYGTTIPTPGGNYERAKLLGWGDSGGGGGERRRGGRGDRPDPRGPGEGAQCVARHGPDGLAPNPMFPHLAGQNAAYLEIQLKQFKTGER